MDSEVGLIDMNARIYDPVLGRFMTPDTIIPSAVSQGLNRYTYGNNNPLSFTDPTGHWSLKKSVAKATQKILGKVAETKYVGGLLAVGLLSNPMFASVYGPSTGDWKSVGRATATSAVLAASIYAGGVAADAFWAGELTAVQYVAASATIGFDTSFAVSKVNGASNRDAMHSGIKSAEQSALMALVDVAAYNMRAEMIAQSEQDPRNASGVSAGYHGDGKKLGGGRCHMGPLCLFAGEKPSPLGGVQGGPGSIFGKAYAPGSFQDLLVEAYAGVHDWLNNNYWYVQTGEYVGDLQNLTGFAKQFGDALNWVNVGLATPIVAASVIAPYAGAVNVNPIVARDY